MIVSRRGFNINEEHFNRLFPFYVLVDRQLGVIAAGKSLLKICPALSKSQFSNYFTVKRPKTNVSTGDDLSKLTGQLVILELGLLEHPLTLRGQMDYLESEDCYLFVGAPWFGGIDQVSRFSLIQSDFALHDPMLDLLHVLRTQDIATDDIMQLLLTVSEQGDKLKESEAQYRAIVESAVDMIYKTDGAGDFTFVNEITESITGYTRSELLSMNYLDMVSAGHKDKVRDFYTHQLAQKTHTTYYEFPIVTKSGREIWLGQSLQYSHGSRAGIELTALAVDITQRRLAQQNLVLQEEKYRNIIANMNLGLLEMTTDGSIQYANQSFCDMSGFRQEELIGSKTSETLKAQSEKEAPSQRSEGDNASQLHTIRIITKSGEEKWWLTSSAPGYNDKGELVGRVGIYLDVTEQKNLERELKLAKIRAEESSRSKESFLATMSHEIRTPLNAIIGITELMKMDGSRSNEENLSILSFSAKNLLALITDILDMSKIDAGKIDIVRTPVYLRELLNRIYQMFKPACEDKGLELILTVDPAVPDAVIGDELRLSQILNNLISNAINFTSKGHVHISVTAITLASKKVRVNFEIIDTGIGIKKNKLESVFDVFEQADSGIVRQYGGTGLGLSITKKLIELQGGRISLRSKPDKGSTFAFYLDMEPSLAGKQVVEKTNSASDAQQTDLSDKLILLVEDNVINQKVAASFLSHWGLKYDIAANGKEALDMLSRQKYDLALVDLFMPVMDGFETIMRMKKHKATKNIPIIALTASAEVSLMEKAVALGANRCLTKPFNIQELHNAIIAMLNGVVSTVGGAGFVPERRVEGFRHISLSKIEEASLGSSEFVSEMIDMLSGQIPELIDKATAHLHNREMTEFAETIHKMKYNLLMFGMEHLRKDLQYMDESGRKGKYSAKIGIAFDYLRSEWERALPEITEARKAYAED